MYNKLLCNTQNLAYTFFNVSALIIKDGIAIMYSITLHLKFADLLLEHPIVIQIKWDRGQL